MSIRLKLIIIFLAIALIPIAFVSLLTFHNYVNSIESAKYLDMRRLAEFKVERIETYFNGLKKYMEITENLYNIKKNLPVIIRTAGKRDKKEFIEAKNVLDSQLKNMEKTLVLNDIMMADSKGRIVYSSNQEHFSKEYLGTMAEIQQKAFEEGRKGIYFSDIYRDKRYNNRLSMLVTAPAFDLNHVFTGVIAYDVDMSPVYKLIQDVSELGNTGEVLIGKKMGGRIVYLNPLRHDPDSALKRHILIGENSGLPIQEAALGRKGFGISVDYRGKKVIASWQYIPSLEWGLVAKIDEEEAFADIRNLRNLVFLIFFIVLIVSCIMALSFAQSLSVPIMRLAKGAEIIGTGNLEFRVGTNQKDEIGQLSRAFDKMTGDLKKITASRDALDAEILERGKVEAELRALNRELEAFTYSVSHDLRSPLRAIDGFARILTEEYKDKFDDEGKRQFKIISDNIKRMGELIDDLLELSRLGRKEITCSSINLKEILDSVINDIKPREEERKVDFFIKDIPEAAADRVLIKQVFINLLSNALKFTSTKKNAIIEIGGTEEQHRNVYYVRDNGVGFDMQYANKLFGIFQRLHGQEEFEGTGIGLAIVKRIISKHGGEVWAEGKVNDGAAFYFSLPK